MTRRSSCLAGPASRRVARDGPEGWWRSGGLLPLNQALDDFRRLGVGVVAAPDHIGDQPGPPRLVGRAEAGTVVTVEVLMKEEVVTPSEIGLHPLHAAEARPASVLVDEEKRDQPLPEIGGDDVERDVGSRSGRVFDGELVAEEFVDAL